MSEKTGKLHILVSTIKDNTNGGSRELTKLSPPSVAQVKKILGK